MWLTSLSPDSPYAIFVAIAIILILAGASTLILIVSKVFWKYAKDYVQDNYIVEQGPSSVYFIAWIFLEII